MGLGEGYAGLRACRRAGSRPGRLGRVGSPGRGTKDDTASAFSAHGTKSGSPLFSAITSSWTCNVRHTVKWLQFLQKRLMRGTRVLWTPPQKPKHK